MIMLKAHFRHWNSEMLMKMLSAYLTVMTEMNGWNSGRKIIIEPAECTGIPSFFIKKEDITEYQPVFNTSFLYFFHFSDKVRVYLNPRY